MSENESMRRYGLTRARTVEAMARVAQEGWAERPPRHGRAFLPILTSREAYDMGCRSRASTESTAVLEPTSRVDPAALAASREEQRSPLDGGLRRLSRTRLFQADAGFHETPIGRSGDHVLPGRALRRVNRVRRSVEYRITMDRGRLGPLASPEAGTAVASLRVHVEGDRRVETAGLARTRPGDGAAKKIAFCVIVRLSLRQGAARAEGGGDHGRARSRDADDS